MTNFTRWCFEHPSQTNLLAVLICAAIIYGFYRILVKPDIEQHKRLERSDFE